MRFDPFPLSPGELYCLAGVAMARSGEHGAELRIRLGAKNRIPLQPIDPLHGRALAHVVPLGAADAAEPLVTEPF